MENIKTAPPATGLYGKTTAPKEESGRQVRSKWVSIADILISMGWSLLLGPATAIGAQKKMDKQKDEYDD